MLSLTNLSTDRERPLAGSPFARSRVRRPGLGRGLPGQAALFIVLLLAVAGCAGSKASVTADARAEQDKPAFVAAHATWEISR